MWAEWRWGLISAAIIRELVGALFRLLNAKWVLGVYRGLQRLDEAGHWGG